MRLLTSCSSGSSSGSNGDTEGSGAVVSQARTGSYAPYSPRTDAAVTATYTPGADASLSDWKSKLTMVDGTLSQTATLSMQMVPTAIDQTPNLQAISPMLNVVITKGDGTEAKRPELRHNMRVETIVDRIVDQKNTVVLMFVNYKTANEKRYVIVPKDLKVVLAADKTRHVTFETRDTDFAFVLAASSTGAPDAVYSAYTLPPPDSSNLTVSSDNVTDETTQAQLSWTPGEGSLSGYYLKVAYSAFDSIGCDGGTSIDSTKITAKKTTYPVKSETDTYIVTGLTPNQTVYFQLCSANSLSPPDLSEGINGSITLPAQAEATISGMPADPSNVSSYTVTVAGDGVTDYEYALLDNATSCTKAVYSSWTAVATDITGTLTENPHLLCVIGKKNDKNIQPDPTSYAWTSDFTAPNTPTGLTASKTKNGSANSYSNNAAIYFNWSATSDNTGGVGIASNTLTWYAGSACSGQGTDITGIAATATSQAFTGSDSTTYSFTVTAIDKAGNKATSACSGDIFIDLTAPNTPASLTASKTSGGAANSYSNSTSIYFNWGATSDNASGSGIASNTVTWYATNNCSGTATNITGIAAGTVVQSLTGTDGTYYTFKVTTIDKAGNSTTSACSNSILVDTTSPNTPAGLKASKTSGGASNSYSNSTTIYFNWSATSDTAGGSGIASNTVTWYATNNCTGAPTNITGIAAGSTSQSLVGSDGTTYTFKLTTYDNAGNTSAVSACSNSIMIDTTAPNAPGGLTASKTNGGGADSYSDTTSIYFNWSATSDNGGGSGIASNTVTWYPTGNCTGAATQITGIAAGTVVQSFTGTDSTTYTFKVTAIDNAGNTATSACSNSIIVDTTAPNTPAGLAASKTNGGGANTYSNSTTIYFNWTATSDTAGGSGIASNTVTWYATNNCSGAPTNISGIAAGTTSQSLVGSDGSSYTFTVTTYDNAGNTSSVSACSNSITIDTQAPNAPGGLTASKTSGGGADAYSNSTTIYFNWAATSDNGGGTGIASNTVTWYATNNCTGGATNITGIAAGATVQSYVGSDGTTYSFTVTTYDNAGNSATSACSNAILVDTSAPNTPAGLAASKTNGGGADSYSGNTTIYFNWTATSDTAGGSGIASNQVDWYATNNCSGAPTTISGIGAGVTVESIVGLDGTSYTFKVTTTDNAGNSSTSACSNSILVDTTVPNTPGSLAASKTSGGGADSYSGSTTIYFNWGATSDTAGGSGIASNTVTWYATNNCTGAPTNITGIAAGTTAQSLVGTDGSSYTFKVTTYDNAGNVSAVSACSNSITIDTTAPNAPGGLTASKTNGGGADSYSSSTTIYFNWAATSDNGGGTGIASNTVTWYATDNCSGAPTNITGLGAGVTSQSYVGSDGTSYTFKVTTYDNGGNSATSVCSNAILIDTTAPNTPAGLTASKTNGGGADSYSGSTTIYFNWAATSDTAGGSGIASNTVTWYAQSACGGAGTDITGIAAGTTSQSYVGSDGTTYSFKVKTYDNAGNVSGASACSNDITVDTSVPSVPGGLTASKTSGGGADSYSGSTTIYFNWTATSDNIGGTGIASNTVSWYATNNCSGGATDITGIAAGTTVQSLVGSDGTNYTFKVTTYDKAGNSRTSGCSNAILVDTTVPNTPAGLAASKTNGGGANSYSNSTTIYFNWTATSDTAGGSGIASNTVTWYAQSACGGGGTDITGIAAGTTAQSYVGSNGTTYSFKVKTYDNAGNVSATSACSNDITIDTNTPPALAAFSGAACCGTNTLQANSVELTITYPADVSEYTQLKIYEQAGASAPAACGAGTLVTTYNAFAANATVHYTFQTGYTANTSSYLACITGPSGNVRSTDTATNVSASKIHWIFATSTRYNGNRTDVATADGICQTAGNNIDNSLSYVALLSSTNMDGSGHIPVSGKVYNRDSTPTVVFNDFASMWGGGALTNLPNFDESGAAITTNVNAWLGTKSSGAVDTANYCNNWADGTAGKTGLYGVVNDANTYFNGGSQTCNTTYRLYCLSKMVEPLTSFTAVTGSVTDGDVVLTTTIPATTTGYNKIELRRALGPTAPSKACNTGTLVKTYTTFSAGANAFTDATGKSGAYYSYTACLYDGSGVVATTSVNSVRAYRSAATHAMFITSTLHSGALGGLAGADTICGTAGTKLDPSTAAGSWKAFLSVSGTDATSRVALTGDVYNVNGDLVTTSGSGLGGAITNAIVYDENGGNSGGNPVWTGSNTSGASSATDCSTWSSSLNTDHGDAGAGNSATTTWLNDTSSPTCDTTASIYCISTAY